MKGTKRRPRMRDLGEGPEKRTYPGPSDPGDLEGHRLSEQPGAPKSDSADATGEGDVEQLAEDTMDAHVAGREEQSQAGQPGRPRRGSGLLRRRLREDRRPGR